MTFNELTLSATRAVNRVGFQLKKHSPEILVVTGVVGTVVSAVMACKATTKASAIIDKAKEDIDTIHECVNNPEFAEEYTKEDSQKDLAIVYAQTGLKFVKLYGPSVLLGATSIAAILVGHNILRKRSLALAAAYTAADTSFKQYRGRVVERLGEKMDKELLYDIKAKEVTETVADEDGKENTVTKVVEVADPNVVKGQYTFCFDETSTLWVRDAERNKFALLRQQDYANELLKAKTTLSLNDVLELVGLPKCRYGQTVGWVYDKNKIKQIDFGIFDIYCEANRNFINGLEKSIWLTFNVEGNILYSFHA